MKKTLMGLTLALSLATFCINAQAASEEQPRANPAGNPVAQFTGEYWLKSTPTNKEAFLFGIDSAVTVEKYISDKNASAKKGAGQYTLSPFEKGWMEAFQNMSRADIAKAVDDWYAANPDKQNRPVLEVLWWEVISPRLAKNK